MKQQGLKAVAIGIVLLAGAAWLAVSNHCALAVFTPEAEALAVHAHCHGASSDEPAKKTGDEELPCCKVLRATVTANISAPAIQQTGVMPAQEFIVAERLSIAKDCGQPLPEEIDTGPPFASSYAELVLQRSVLTHAPPLFI